MRQLHHETKLASTLDDRADDPDAIASEAPSLFERAPDGFGADRWRDKL